MLKVTFGFDGSLADEHLLNFYDASQAITGFQRTLALTTHLVLNGEIITQAPSLKGANILLGTIEEGSLKIPAYITSLSLAVYSIGSLESKSPLGHLIYSAYDYVVSESLGFNVDYDKSLGQSYDELQKKGSNQLPILDQSRFDSLIEKCEGALIQMHRPIVASKTATRGTVTFSNRGETVPINGGFDDESYDYLAETKRDTQTVKIVGKISSYNINTFKGRVFCITEKRPIPFELSEGIRTRRYIKRITASLSRNAVERDDVDADVVMTVYRNVAKSGRLKSYFVVNVEPKQV